MKVWFIKAFSGSTTVLRSICKYFSFKVYGTPQNRTVMFLLEQPQGNLRTSKNRAVITWDGVDVAILEVPFTQRIVINLVCVCVCVHVCVCVCVCVCVSVCRQ